MAAKGVFETVGGLADSLHQWTGLASWPWGIRLTLAIILDVIDIASRLIMWPFFLAIPGISHGVHLVLNGIITFLGALLWGAPGLLQALDMLLGAVPGFGFFFDILPVLTIAGFISRKRGKETAMWRTEGGEWETGEIIGPEAQIQPLSLAAERSYSMIGLGVFGGFVLAVVLWWWFDGNFSWLLFFPVGGGILGFFFQFSRQLEIPPQWLRWGALIAGLALGGILANVLRLSQLTSPQDYRLEAWQVLVAEGDFRVKSAQGADDLRETLAEKKEEFKEKTRDLRDAAREFLRKRYKGGGPLDPLINPLLEEPQPPQPEEKFPEGPELEEGAPISGEQEKEIASLNLGPFQQKLFRSKYMLERAKKIRKEEIHWWALWSMAPGTALLFIGLAALSQKQRQQGGQASVYQRESYEPHGGSDSSDDWVR